jgi:hypothetical protein
MAGVSGPTAKRDERGGGVRRHDTTRGATEVVEAHQWRR